MQVADPNKRMLRFHKLRIAWSVACGTKLNSWAEHMLAKRRGRLRSRLARPKVASAKPRSEKVVGSGTLLKMIAFRTLGLYIPACVLYSTRDKIALEVKSVSAKMVRESWLVESQ